MTPGACAGSAGAFGADAASPGVAGADAVAVGTSGADASRAETSGAGAAGLVNAGELDRRADAPSPCPLPRAGEGGRRPGEGGALDENLRKDVLASGRLASDVTPLGDFQG